MVTRSLSIRTVLLVLVPVAPVVATALVGACVDFDSLSNGVPLPDAEADAASEVDGASPPADGGGILLSDAHAPIDAPSDAPPVTCVGTQINCNGACIDPTTDPANCNGCGNVCPSGSCGTTLTAPMTSSPAGWKFNGTAVFNGSVPSGQMTQAGVAGQAGTIVYQTALLMDGMDAKFQFRIGEGGDGRGDGIGFIIEQNGPSAVGAPGGGLGMGGLTGFGVEFDTFDNNVCGDTSDDHVGVDELASCASQSGMPTSFFEADVTSTVDVGDAQWHQAEITLAAGSFSLMLDGQSLFSSVAVTGLSTGPTYYVGFSGGTGEFALADGGTAGNQQEVKDIVITFSTPRCL
jgi:hypothetical protein